MTSSEQLITTAEAARRLVCSISTVARLVRNGELPHTKDRVGYLFDPHVIEQERQRRIAQQREIVNALEESLS